MGAGIGRGSALVSQSASSSRARCAVQSGRCGAASSIEATEIVASKPSVSAQRCDEMRSKSVAQSRRDYGSTLSKRVVQ
jgi:hypothetical protein